MVSDDDFDALLQRVKRLEHVVSGIDSDTAALQAQRRADLELLMALRGTQLEQGERLDRVETEIRELRVETRELRAETLAGFETIIGMLRRLESDPPA